MKFTVHLYTEVRVKVIDVEAETPGQAKEHVEEHLDLHALLDNPHVCCTVSGTMRADSVEWAEGPATALVDPILGGGDVAAAHDGVRPASNDVRDLLEAQTMGFAVHPDPDQPGMYYFSDPSGERSDISFESEVAAWGQILAELPTYQSMQ